MGMVELASILNMYNHCLRTTPTQSIINVREHLLSSEPISLLYLAPELCCSFLLCTTRLVLVRFDHVVCSAPLAPTLFCSVSALHSYHTTWFRVHFLYMFSSGLLCVVLFCSIHHCSVLFCCPHCRTYL